MRCPFPGVHKAILNFKFSKCILNCMHTAALPDFQKSIFKIPLQINCWDVHKTILNFETQFTGTTNTKHFQNSAFWFFKIYTTSRSPKSIFKIQFTGSSNVDSRSLPVHQKLFLKFRLQVNCGDVHSQIFIKSKWAKI